MIEKSLQKISKTFDVFLMLFENYAMGFSSYSEIYTVNILASVPKILPIDEGMVVMVSFRGKYNYPIYR